MSETLLGIIIGGAIAIASSAVTELVRSRSTAARERDARSAEHQRRLDDIQRDNLLSLQEALTNWMRVHGKMHFADTMSLRNSGKLHLYPDGLSDEENEANRRLMYLTERVRDDLLREALDDLRGFGAALEARRAVEHAEVTESRLESELAALVDRAGTVQRQLGTVLRSYL